MAQEDVNMNTDPVVRLDSEYYRDAETPENNETTEEKKEPKKARRLFPFFTLILVLLLGAAVFCELTIMRSIAGNGGLMAGLKGKSVLGGSSKSGTISEDVDFGDYKEISLTLSKLKSTNTEWTNIDKNPSETGFSCIATVNEGERMIYNLDPSAICGKYTLKDFNYIWVDSVNAGFCCLINIPGEEVDLSNYYILVHDDSGNLASRLIINCYEAKVVKLSKTILTGTLLAPLANVEYDATVVYGAVYAKASAGARAYFKQINFTNYTEILRESEKVSFVNTVMRPKVLECLRKSYPDKYTTYSDDYIPTLYDLSLIKEFSIDGEYIQDLHTDIDDMVNLEKLSVRNTKLRTLDLTKLTALKSVNIGETEIKTITFAEDNAIEEIIADDAVLDTLEAENLTRLKKLNVKNSTFSKMPDFASFTGLVELNITNTGIDNNVITSLSELKYLKRLIAPENPKVTSIDFSLFKTLAYADLKECALSKIQFAGSYMLTDVDVSYNKMIDVDASQAPALKQIYAYGGYKTVCVKDESVKVSCLAGTTVTYKSN